MFTIPHPADAIEASPGVYPQSQVDKVDFDIIAAAFANYGVLTTGACLVTAQGTPDKTVHVAAGDVMVGGSTTDDIVSVSAGNVTLADAHLTLDRFDLVVVSDAGALSAVAGTASATPAFPAIPASRTVLAAVYLPANDATIATNQIVDKRMLLPDPPAPAAGQWTTIRKSANQTKVSDTTLAADNTLEFAMVANGEYAFRGRVFVSTESATPGFKMRLVQPASPVRMLTRAEAFNSATGASQSTRIDIAVWSTDFTMTSTGAFSSYAEIEGIIHNGANAGDVEIHWAQSTSSADDTIVLAGSYLEYMRVDA